ncbi:hypothetical protein XF28_22130, partial [Escherichia coli]
SDFRRLTSGTSIPPYFFARCKKKKTWHRNGMLAAEFTGGYPSFGFAENTDDLFVGKTLLHGDVLMWLMKTLLTSGCTNQRGAGHQL